MTLSFAAVDPSRTHSSTLRSELLDTWIAVTNDGGAVSFTASAPEDAIAVTLDEALQRVARGEDALGVPQLDGVHVGVGLLVDRDTSLRRHWRKVLRVMVRPECQGFGAGRSS